MCWRFIETRLPQTQKQTVKSSTFKTILCDATVFVTGPPHKDSRQTRQHHVSNNNSDGVWNYLQQEALAEGHKFEGWILGLDVKYLQEKGQDSGVEVEVSM